MNKHLLKYLPFLAAFALQNLPVPTLAAAKKNQVTTPTQTSELESLKIQLPVEKYYLPNGLTVLLHEDHNVPMISYHTWYRVGSRDEGPGVTGAAHMLEHMMFRGAKKYSGSDFDRLLQSNGISHNAFTSNDYTGFYQNLPSSKLELVMDMEVDRMRFLKISAEDLKAELQVVGEERRWRIDNNPSGLLYETAISTMFQVHPYSWPVIGHMSDIQAYTPEKLRKFYDTFYVPNNAVLVLAGDFKSDQVKSLIEKYYGPLEKKELPQRTYQSEPPPKKGTSKAIDWDVQSRSFMFGYPGVAAGTKDGYALDLAATALGEGVSSRLHKKLVYKMQVALGTSASNWTPTDPGFFSIGVTMMPGKTAKDVRKTEEVVQEEIAAMKEKNLSDKELTKIKNRLMKETVDGLSTIDAKARSLAVNEIVFGDYQRLFSDLERYNSVSSKDIREVSRKYFKDNLLVKVYLNPLDKKTETKKANQ